MAKNLALQVRELFYKAQALWKGLEDTARHGGPDSSVLADWFHNGALVGFTEDIPTKGVFPEVEEPSPSQTWSGSLKGGRTTHQPLKRVKS